VPIWGTSAASIDAAEDRDAFHALCNRLGVPQPAGGVAERPEEAAALAERIGYPVMVRPSYVLGGRAMRVVGSRQELAAYLTEVYAELPDNPSILIDDFIEGATEVDVDALSDGTLTVVAGIMEHIELAGVHSGDSATVTPPVTLSPATIDKVTEYTVRLAEAIGVKGLINVQFVIRGDEVLVVEANPRASRTVPYLSKAIDHPLAKYAALIAAGQSLEQIGFTSSPTPQLYSVKEVVLPFLKFRGVLPLLGPEMRSTGETMGIDADPYLAYYKAAVAAGQNFPAPGAGGTVRLIGQDLSELSADLVELGYTVVTGPVPAGQQPDYDLLLDTQGTAELRRALENGVAYSTTLQGARWSVKALKALKGTELTVNALQDLRRPAVAAD
jgi:carbamoyl-phosphate synthase large subunit